MGNRSIKNVNKLREMVSNYNEKAGVSRAQILILKPSFCYRHLTMFSAPLVFFLHPRKILQLYLASNKQPLFNPIISDNLYLDEGELGKMEKGFSLCVFQSNFVLSKAN